MAELPARDDPLSAAVAKAAAVYTPFTLSFYDAIVHGLSNRFAWRCPTQKIVELYASNLSANHLEAGVGTGLFIDRVAHAALDRLVLLDINGSCLARAGGGLRGLRRKLGRRTCSSRSTQISRRSIPWR